MVCNSCRHLALFANTPAVFCLLMENKEVADVLSTTSFLSYLV